MSTEKPAYEFLDPPSRAGELGRLGPYRIVGVLGKGGMGEVFRATDGRLKRTVAVKMMNKKFAGTTGSRKRFVEEARSMAAVHHDNVATIFEVGVHRGMPFLAMELLKGQSLFEKIKADKSAGQRFDYVDAIRIAREVAMGLGAAHACGIYHRDIKPANIWLEEPSGRAKILDFGLAVAGTDRLTPRGSVVGSPGYLSPEQARNEPVDDRTDLYSLGVMLYQMLSGTLPLRSDTMTGQLIAIICQDFVPLATVAPQTPAPLCELIERLLSKEARDRPSSATQLVKLIDDCEQRCSAEHQAAMQIVVGPTTAGKAKATDSSVSRTRVDVTSKVRLIPWWAYSIAGLLVLAIMVAWVASPNRIASVPNPVDSTSNRSDVSRRRVDAVPVKQAVITAASLASLELSPVNASSLQVTGGEAARFKMRLINRASGDADDPRQLNAGADVVAQLVTYLVPADGKRLKAPVFPRKFSASSLPQPGESDEFEIQILTDRIAPTQYKIVFELQTPGGTVVGQSNSNLAVEENLMTSELLGYQTLRTADGRGADTYVSSTSDESFGDRHIVQGFQGPDGSIMVQEHIYLRFDLAKCKFDRKEIDRVILLLTVAQHGEVDAENKFVAYGIVQGLDSGWTESGPGYLTWSQSPLREGVESQTLLGAVQFMNRDNRLKDQADQIRISGTAFDDFLRTSRDDRVTIALVRQSRSSKRTYFRSKEGRPSESPGLAIRQRQ
ncbi:serine/threonine-protein kinase [Rubripirellula reticaptiva]|uniref:Serine/threonine-protein kinase Pkn1 n=1 Tax=Rubripirellula reticaptiva TaxID=2528013 RepID=A0A5C6F8V0_9BACT|nr:serine/threonine-protein kinase [Rubripirellula reticaptiva]TWU57332.1 Serine/threonine-protein kinase Pkn1 [Rubripirellula reticaptiva]